MDPNQPKLGEVLVAAGVISQLELLEALELQKADPRKPKLGRLLIEKGWATEGEICRALSGQLRLPFVDLRGITLDPSVVAVIPADLAAKHQCIAVGMRGDELLVAMSDPTNLMAIDDLRTATKRKIKPVVAQPSLIARAIQSYYAIQDSTYWAQVATGRPPARLSDVPSGGGGGVLKKAPDLPRIDPAMRRIQQAVRPSQPVSGEVIDVARELLKPASPEALEYTRRRVSESETEESISTRSFDQIGELLRFPQTSQSAEALREEAERAVNAMLLDAIKNKATEIRGEPGLEGFSIQFKSGGTYREVMGIPKRLQAATTAFLKQLAGLDPSQHKIEQEGRLSTRVDGNEFSGTIRFSPSLNGEKFLIKTGAVTEEHISIEDLGLSEDDQKLMKAALGLPRGAILVAAPPGSGKSTTLLAMLSYVARKHRNIQYVGAMPDRRLPEVDVTEVDPSSGIDYSEAMRMAMRENPKVVFIDDLPNADVAEQALVAAMSGRLVVAGIESADGPSAVVDLVEMGVDPAKVGSAVALVVSQRVVKKVCENCKTPYEPSAKVLKALGSTIAEARWVRGRGCEVCTYSGYKGTAAFFQLMPITDLMKDQMKVQVSTTALMHSAASIGVPTLKEAGLALARAGITTIEEIARVLEVVEESLITCPGCGAEVKADYIVCPFCSHSLSAGTCSNCGEEMKQEWIACPYCGARREGVSAAVRPRVKSSFKASGSGIGSIYESGPVPGVGASTFPILVVEPKDKLRMEIEDLLARSGYYVLGASEPEQALRLTVGHKPSLIFVAESPEAGFDGVELAHRIRRTAQGAAVPIVFMSDEGGGATLDVGGSEGDVIRRPVVESEILSAVRRRIGDVESG